MANYWRTILVVTLTLSLFSPIMGTVRSEESESNQEQIVFSQMSARIKKHHEYGQYGQSSTVSALGPYVLFVVEFSIFNGSDDTLNYSTEDFTVVDGENKSVTVPLIGVGDSVASGGVTITTEGSIKSKEGEPIINYEGKVGSSGNTFLFFRQGPKQKYKETFVYVLPEDTKLPTKLTFAKAGTKDAQ